jgi:hypothetical protein
VVLGFVSIGVISMRNNLLNQLCCLHVLSRLFAYRDVLTGIIIPVGFWFNVVFSVLENFKNGVRRSELPPPDPVEELLRERPELGVFGREWVERFHVSR